MQVLHTCMELSAHLSILFAHAYQQIPNSHVAASVCYSLEAFMKLEKRLCEGHEGAVAMREQRSRLEKLIKTWASMDIQVSGPQSTLPIHCQMLIFNIFLVFVFDFLCSKEKCFI